MEWIRANANFTYFDKNNEHNIYISNTDNLAEEFYRYSQYFLETSNVIIKHMLENCSNRVKDMWFFPCIDKLLN